MKLKDKKVREMFEKLGDCEVIAFDPKEIAEKISLAYNLRSAAHETLLEADKILDEVLKELSGIKDEKKSKTITKSGEGSNTKTKGVGKNTKRRRLGKKA